MATCGRSKLKFTYSNDCGSFNRVLSLSNEFKMYAFVTRVDNTERRYVSSKLSTADSGICFVKKKKEKAVSDHAGQRGVSASTHRLELVVLDTGVCSS